jgi:hypothetical protein
MMSKKSVTQNSSSAIKKKEGLKTETFQFTKKPTKAYNARLSNEAVIT